MPRIALFTACCFASGMLLAFQAPARAAALQPAGLHSGAFHDHSFHLARRGGFRGGGARVWRGGGRAFAFRGGGRAWRGGRVVRGGVWRGGRAYAWRGGRVWRGGVWRGGRAYAWRGGRVWRGGRRVWRPGWGWVAAGVVAAPYFYGASCPLVRRTVWTPYGYRVRWVRRCW